MEYNFENIKYKPEKNLKTYSINENDTEDTVSLGKWINEKETSYSYAPNKTISVFDVASYILKKTGTLTTMKLHKLLYYAQAWSLVWDEKPLFEEEIEAWANGPVIRNLFSYHKGYYNISNIEVGNPNLLSKDQKETIDSVLKFYGDKPSQWLIELTHMEEPWRKARIGLAPTERGNRIISKESLANYYSSL